MTSIIENFRDIGGLVNVVGKKIRFKHIYRTRQLVYIEEKSLVDIVSLLNIKTVIDFRTNNEMTRYNKYPSEFLSKINFYNFPLECEGIHVDRRIKKERNYDGYEYLYYHLITNEGEVFRKTFDLIAQKKFYPIIIHCIAGKDRTGIFIALLLMVLNIERDLIIKDYLKSPKAEEKNIQHLFDLIKEQGGILKYLKSIGVTETMSNKIIENLLN